MFRWLKGPGSKFLDPLPGSTNYLSAYDENGGLIRARPKRGDKKRQDGKAAQERGEDQDEDENERRSEDDEDGESSLDSVEQHELRQDKNIAGQKELPPEEPRDLQPFLNNRDFRSQPVLSEELREEVWRRVAVENKSIKVVSAELGVEMNRVGAVVRLKTIEKDWQSQGKPLIKPYNRAVLAMLPQTPYYPRNPTFHESINDLPTHSATLQQLFVPTSESRSFTRVDAGRAFADDLLPADQRIPHPELVELEREKSSGISRDDRIARQRERGNKEREQRAIRDQKRQEREARMVKKVKPSDEGGKGGRWEWRFKEVRVERDTVGLDGRGLQGVGARYGIPHEDRKKGIIKIPRSVG